MEGFVLPADVLAEIYGVLQACAEHYQKSGLDESAEHARYLAFQLLDTPTPNRTNDRSSHEPDDPWPEHLSAPA